MTATEPANSQTAQHAARPGRPTMLSHAAFISQDTAATVAFYAGLLGMDLVAAVLDDAGAARASLAEWEQVKAEARATGRDMARVLAGLTRQRSHRRTSGLEDG